jgi:hypothetical protein
VSAATSLSSGYEAVAFAATLRSSGRGQPATAAASAAPQGREAALINAVRINAVPLDIASYGAILGNIGGSIGSSPRDPAAFRDVMEMIGGTLSQGQGGYYLAINAPGGSLMTAMTPSQLQAYMQSKGTLYPDTLTSSNGHTYSLYDLLKQAFAADRHTEQMQAADPGMSDPGLLVAEALLDKMQADDAPAGSRRSPLPSYQLDRGDTAKSIRTLVLQMDGSGNNGVRLSIVYFPPGLGNGPQAWSAPATTAAAPETLQLTA